MQKFIMKYLTSGPRETEYVNELNEDNQLSYEKYLRSVIADHPMKKPKNDICLGKYSDIDEPWQYYYDHGNWFVDFSSFYSVLNRVEMLAVTGLYSEVPKTIKTTLWSYAAVSVWCNGELAASIDVPRYKPICKKEMLLELNRGYNEILIRLQTLGVRDTRTIFGIELNDNYNDVQVMLSDNYGDLDTIKKLEDWLDSLILNGDLLQGKGEAPEGTRLCYDEKHQDYADVKTPPVWLNIAGQIDIKLQKEKPSVIVVCEHGSTKISRRFEKLTDIVPVYSEHHSFEANRMDIIKKIAAVESLNRGDKFGFAISNILARRALGIIRDRDEVLLYETLDQIEKRYDCADFLVSGLIRYFKNYPLDDKQRTRIREVITGFRYWMNQDGSDAMCFWSENHALMFYSSAMLCGAMFPEDYFVRAHMKGKELEEFGRERVMEWLEDVEKGGYEEFLSSIYISVTFVALLNLIDYGNEEISKRATALTDRLVTLLAKHTFDGSVIAPMCRVYRDVLYPFRQGAQSILNLINPKAPYAFAEGWLGFYANTTYTFPEGLKELMKDEVEEIYTSGNALIQLKKCKHFCMTSVRSPRTDSSFKRWTNLTLLEEPDQQTHYYTKSLNERFHGTTCFEPGVYGYQQHLWYAALDNQTAVFVNHPGETCDSGSLRPGYWFGNGIIPAVKQSGNMIGSVYVIPDTYPIHFTHVFWPTERFDEMKYQKGWLFGKKKDGYIGLWCSDRMEPFHDQLFHCEFRIYNSASAFLCVCDDAETCSNLNEFIKKCMELDPKYDSKTCMLTANGYVLAYAESFDNTQYI